MSFIFTMRNAPKSSIHRRENSLPAISEDSASFNNPRDPPAVPPRAWNRPSDKHFALGRPPRFNYETSPPPYGSSEEEGPLDGENGEKLAELRRGVVNNKHIAKRGGCWRLLIIGIIVALCIVGLVVGLVVGLRNRDNKDKSESGSSTTSGGASGNLPGGTTNPASNTTFPAGSYSFDTYLSTVSTNCTSNPATWLCYPYTTYAQNPTASNAIFDWIISPIEGTSDNYTISSTSNPFSITFANASLSLQSAGNSDEHYFFQMTMQKPTLPTTQLGSENVAATCYFNQTNLEGYLYTKMAKTYPTTANATDTNENQAFAAWPNAVKIEQVATSGSGTPTCLDPSGNSLGDFSVSQQGETCDCLYINTGT
ncbi:hypothetical protein LSUE1_G002711 [Lachnellula suecica]|uniref:Tat pathway signal sequence n=1 Tax=Lachnellula suecica TaxID=602035 RepID=A0A8T9CE88_9HELO|nr:hypothetical protein LSUE1_G002711 [Lachnellula suecica]